MPEVSDSTIILKKKAGVLKAWFLASRPRTLPVSLPPIIVGTALAAQQVEQLNWMLVGCALLCSLGIQIGTNLVNDALDFKKGADAVGRIGPKRMTQEGILSFQQVLSAGGLCFGFALLCGIPLMLAGGWPLVWVLFLSIACGYFYTGGPFPLAYTGISDLFVLIFFGWISTGSIYFLQTGKINFPCLLAATQIGLLAIVPHAINNLRDRLSDACVGKNTLAVRFGPRFARYEITSFSLIPFALGLLWIEMGKIWMAALPFLTLPIITRNLQSIWLREPSPQYNQFLATSAICQLLFGCLLALGVFLAV
jgi:1,4-dihydroxy-2-naphthoate octaprenyltransferase